MLRCESLFLFSLYKFLADACLWRIAADTEWSLLAFTGASSIQRAASISVQQSRLAAGIQWSHVVSSTYYCSSSLDVGPHSTELGCSLKSGVRAEMSVGVDWTGPI